jgi:hypothetical protein
MVVSRNPECDEQPGRSSPMKELVGGFAQRKNLVCERRSAT